jgi:hypothetical protein
MRQFFAKTSGERADNFGAAGQGRRICGSGLFGHDQ